MPSYTDVMPYLPYLMVAILTIGMAAIFFWADRSTPSTRSLALWLTGLGIGMLIVIPKQLAMFGWSSENWNLVDTCVETVTLLAGLEWLQRVRRTAAHSEGRRNWGAWILWLAQGCMIWHFVIQLVFLDDRIPPTDFGAIFDASRDFNWKSFWIRGLPIQIALSLAGISITLMLFWRLDKAEWMRLFTTVIATPFLISGLLIPESHRAWIPFTTLFGEIIFFAGMIQYLISQGQRAQFMSRFLSPQVSQLVRKRGLRTALVPQQLPISIVACDLRGFTRYAHGTDSTAVLNILHEYYRAVGEVATQYGGTVKDHAGDGILILVGAPLPIKDHVNRALEMGVQIRDAGKEVMEKLEIAELGIGVGIASGVVTVGAIGGASRLEYAAVGTAVNLASRLCDRAAPGEVLISGSLGSNDLPGHFTLIKREALELKGFDDPVPVFSLDSNKGKFQETLSAVRIRPAPEVNLED